MSLLHYQEIVFKPFEVLAKLDKELSKGLVRAAKEAVEESEKTRGCGQDIRLRLVMYCYMIYMYNIIYHIYTG